MPSLDVVTVGSAVIDHIYTLSNLPEPDGGAFVRGHTTAVGGVAANVASALTELKRETGIITRLGADATEIEIGLRAQNIDINRIQSDPEESSYSLVLRGPNGERMVIAGGRSVPNLRLTDADMEYLRDASVVFTSAYAPDAVVSTLVEARERGEISALVFDLAGPLDPNSPESKERREQQQESGPRYRLETLASRTSAPSRTMSSQFGQTRTVAIPGGANTRT